MTADEAEAYHRAQIATFADTSVDLVAALTLAYPAEAIGVARAAGAFQLPVVISFTLEVDGTLPTGGHLGDAIEAVDAATDRRAIYYGLNCAHPSHLAPVLDDGGEWTERIRALRANASRRSHVELDEATELDRGDEVELAQWYAQLRDRHPQLTVLGGCCGTDEQHVAAIAEACLRQV